MKPSFILLRRLFARVAHEEPFPMKALERASSICNACMGMVKSITLRMAIEQQIPMVAYGWSPGQAPISSAVFRMNVAMVRRMHKSQTARLRAIGAEDMDPYLLNERHFARLDDFPHNVSPLLFLPYDEDLVTQRIQQLGWQPPGDTDGNSTNCLLNAFANRVHLRKHGFHPYAFEIAGLVRRGAMTRQAGLAKLEDLGPEGTARAVAERLGVPWVPPTCAGASCAL
jgi:tRNA(Ile)-lysidine synthase TilS/MesJ